MPVFLVLEHCWQGPRMQDLRPGCVLESLESYRKCWCLGPSPKESYLIGIGCGLKVQQNFRITVGDSGQMSSWYITWPEGSLRSLLPAVSFWRVLEYRSLSCTNWCCCSGQAMCQGSEPKCKHRLDTWQACSLLTEAWVVSYSKNLNHRYMQLKSRGNMPTSGERVISDAADLPELLPDCEINYWIIEFICYFKNVSKVWYV